MAKSFLFSFYLLSFISLFNTAQAQTISYSFEELFRIGDESQTGDEYIFGWPAFVVSDQDGNVYVADRNRNLIRKYDSDGRYLLSFGRQGRGPGEFVEISTLFMDHTAMKLIVYDRMSIQATIFDFDGQYIASHQIRSDENVIISPWMGRADGEGNYFLLYRNPVIPGVEPVAEDHLIHEFDQTLTKKGSFAHASRFGDLENEAVESLIGGPTTGFFELLPNNRLAVVPFLFEGEIHVYEKNDGNWEFSHTLTGVKPDGDVIREIDVRNAPEYARVSGTPRGTIARLIFSESIGVHLIENRYLVCYTFERDDEYHGTVKASLFDLDTRNFLGQISIDELNEDSPEPRQISPVRGFWNQEGKLYFIDDRFEEPQIAVVGIEFHIM